MILQLFGRTASDLVLCVLLGTFSFALFVWRKDLRRTNSGQASFEVFEELLSSRRLMTGPLENPLMKEGKERVALTLPRHRVATGRELLDHCRKVSLAPAAESQSHEPLSPGWASDKIDCGCLSAW